MRHGLRRLRYHAWGLLLVPVAPLLLPILGTAVWLDNIGRRQETPRARHGGILWRCWWWYGYHGLYQIDWWLKHRRAQRAGIVTRCEQGNWTLSSDEALWLGERCCREQLHRGSHAMVADKRAA